MSFLTIFITIFFSFFFLTLIAYSYGKICNKYIFKNNLDEIENIIFGTLCLGFLALFLNFFISINNNITAIVYTVGLIYLFKNFNKLNFQYILKIIFIITLLSVIVILYENINRPDGPFYHLSYISFLNTEKIIIGLSNLNTRFGYTSLWQYCSSIFRSDFLSLHTILFPQILIFSSSIIYFLNNIKNEKNSTLKLLSIIFIIIITVDLSRYSDFGNESPSHIIFFIFNYLIIKDFLTNKINNYDNNFTKILFLALCLFTAKLTYSLVFVSLLYFIFKFKKKINIFKTQNLIICLLFFGWVLKNILISGCFLSPLQISCIKSLEHTDIHVEYENNLINAWSKGYPDSGTKLNYKQYSSGFGWINTWFQNHFKKAVKEILKVFLAILIFYCLFKKNLKNFKRRDLKIFMYINLLYIFLWFLYFPVYRFGSGFMFSFISILIISIFDFKKIDNSKLKIFLSMLLIFFLSKNTLRIYNNFDDNKLYLPKITLNEKEIKNIKKYFYKNQNSNFYYYSKSMCYYYNCTSYDLNIDNLAIDKFYRYKKIKVSNRMKL